jgi:hypothetical protein
MTLPRSSNVPGGSSVVDAPSCAVAATAMTTLSAQRGMSNRLRPGRVMAGVFPCRMTTVAQTGASERGFEFYPASRL